MPHPPKPEPRPPRAPRRAFSIFGRQRPDGGGEHLHRSLGIEGANEDRTISWDRRVAIGEWARRVHVRSRRCRRSRLVADHAGGATTKSRRRPQWWWAQTSLTKPFSMGWASPSWLPWSSRRLRRRQRRSRRLRLGVAPPVSQIERELLAQFADEDSMPKPKNLFPRGPDAHLVGNELGPPRTTALARPLRRRTHPPAQCPLTDRREHGLALEEHINAVSAGFSGAARGTASSQCCRPLQSSIGRLPSRPVPAPICFPPADYGAASKAPRLRSVPLTTDSTRRRLRLPKSPSSSCSSSASLSGASFHRQILPGGGGQRCAPPAPHNTVHWL